NCGTRAAVPAFFDDEGLAAPTLSSSRSRRGRRAPPLSTPAAPRRAAARSAVAAMGTVGGHLRRPLSWSRFQGPRSDRVEGRDAQAWRAVTGPGGGGGECALS